MNAVLAPVDDALSRVRSGLERRVAALGGRIGDHLASDLGRPGKMLRARYALLLGEALGVPQAASEAVARAAELVHSASLLHDDVIDNADTRRGAPTPNALFGRTTGILMGDLAFTEGLSEAMDLGRPSVEALVRAVREMTVGEIQEEFLQGSLNVSVEGYYGVAARKTGALFEWVGEALSLAATLPHRRSDPGRLGVGAGILLQIVDDIHDFTLSKDVAGKEPGRDYFNGRLTLPGILAMDDEATRAEFMRLWAAKPKGEPEFKKMLCLLESAGQLEAAREKARELMKSLLPLVDALPEKARAAELRMFMELLFRREF